MSLSSNTILHQTSFEGLKGILSSKHFRLKYCKEPLENNFIPTNIAFPMVSFSDIPFSSLHQHLKKYDDYTIGMKKDWAVSKGLNPVLYLESKSVLTEVIVKNFDRAMQSYDLSHAISTGQTADAFFSSAYTLAFSKNYQGVLRTKNEFRAVYRFSDEREWRYVPNFTDSERQLLYIPIESYEKDKAAYNTKISSYTLGFDVADINYIIVVDQDEIDEIRALLASICPSQTSHINFFTNEQVEMDFLGYEKE